MLTYLKWAAFAAVIVFASVFTRTYTVNEYEAKIDAAKLAAETQARVKEQEWQAELNKARATYDQRTKTIQRDSDSVRLERDGLRDELASSDLSKASRAAIEARANALDLIVGKCAEALEGMARNLDQCAADRQMMYEAWPR